MDNYEKLVFSPYHTLPVRDSENPNLFLAGNVNLKLGGLNMKSRDKTRYERFRHINRKKRIIKDQHNYWSYKHEGMLSKGKIHCSCWMCRSKSYDEPSMSDKRKMEKMNSSYDDWFFDGPEI